MAINLKGRSFLTLMDFTPDEIRYLLNLSHDLKTKIHAVEMYRNNGDIEYTCRKYHISRTSLYRWNKQYDGTFIFEVTIIKDKNDDPESVEKIKDIIQAIKPEKLEVVRIEDEPFKKKLCADDKRFSEIVAELA